MNDPNRRRRRELLTAAALCAAGSALVIFAAGRQWATVHATNSIVPLTRSLTGHELGGAAIALGWAGLAGLAVLFATRGRTRAAIGALLALFGAGITSASWSAVRHARVLQTAADTTQLLRIDAHVTVSTNAWWLVSVAGGLLLVAAGALTTVRGARWPGMSSRYDPAGPPAAAAPVADSDPAGMWKSLDRGEDPTNQKES